MSRNRFPLNVHTAMSMANEGISLRTKKMIVIFCLIFLTAVITWAGTNLFSESQFRLLAGLISLCLGIGISVFIYNHFIINKQEEAFEDSHTNKIFKFFKLSLSSNYDAQEIEGVECSRYISGDAVIALRIAVGNITPAGEATSEDFLDTIFGMAHNQKVKINIFAVPEDWESSEMHLSYLRRLSRIRDHKLRASLSAIDAHRANVYKNSSVLDIVIMFESSSSKLKQMIPIIKYVAGWKRDSLRLSSLREVSWVRRSELVKLGCDYLGTKMIDISPLGNKEERVVLDIRKMVRPYVEDVFFAQTHNERVQIDTESVYIRHSIFNKKGGRQRENNRRK